MADITDINVYELALYIDLPLFAYAFIVVQLTNGVCTEQLIEFQK